MHRSFRTADASPLGSMNDFVPLASHFVIFPPFCPCTWSPLAYLSLCPRSLRSMEAYSSPQVPPGLPFDVLVSLTLSGKEVSKPGNGEGKRAQSWPGLYGGW